MWMSPIPLTPPLAITGMSTARARSTVACDVAALEQPVAPDIGEQQRRDARHPRTGAPCRSPPRPTRRPSRASRPCRPSRRPRRRSRRESRAPPRAPDRDSPAPRCRSPRARRRASNHRSIAARSRMPPPSCTWPGKRATIARDRVAIDRLRPRTRRRDRRRGGNPRPARRTHRLRRGIVAIDRRAVHIALGQAHDLPALQVDRGEDDQAHEPPCQEPLEQRRARSAGSFRGGIARRPYCRAPIAAVTGPAWSVVATTSSPSNA